MLYYLILVLHGLPFTIPIPHYSTASCEAEGRAATSDVGGYFFCVDAQLVFSKEKFWGRRLDMISNPAVIGEPAPSRETAPTYMLTVPNPR